MKPFIPTLAFLLVAQAGLASAAPPQDPLCAPLRAFASSVEPGHTRTIKFHTVWGGDFQSETARTIYAKRCIANGYAPGEALCKVLMQHGAVEFSGNNAKAAVMCLSPATSFASPMALDALDVSFSYGTPDRGSNMSVSYRPADKVRGMVLVITAAGY